MKDAALEDAKKSVDLDAGYSKAYYRKGQVSHCPPTWLGLTHMQWTN